MYTELLPAGSIVLLRNSEKKVMITGFAQKAEETGAVWDYSGVVWPLGYLGRDYNIVFNSDDVDSIYQIGHQDADQRAFTKWVSDKLAGVRQTTAE